MAMDGWRFEMRSLAGQQIKRQIGLFGGSVISDRRFDFRAIETVLAQQVYQLARRVSAIGIVKRRAQLQFGDAIELAVVRGLLDARNDNVPDKPGPSGEKPQVDLVAAQGSVDRDVGEVAGRKQVLYGLADLGLMKYYAWMDRHAGGELRLRDGQIAVLELD